MDKKYLLGVDVGTTSIKVVVIDENAKPLGISSSSYRLITPDQNSVQIDMEDMWNVSVFFRKERNWICPKWLVSVFPVFARGL